MSSDGKEYKTEITADPSSFESGMRQAVRAAVEAQSAITAEFRRIGESAGLVTKAFAGMAAALAGGKMFGDAVSNASAYNSQVGALSKTMGLSMEAASGVNVALRSIGKTSDDLTSASFKLLKQVNTNEAGLKALGLQTRDQNGHLRSMMDLMTDGLKVLSEYAEGSDRDTVAMTMFGKSAQEAMGLLKLTSDTLNAGKEHAEKYGLVIGKDNVDASKKLKRAQEELKLSSEALSINIGNALIPVLVDLSKILLVTLPNAFKEAGKAFVKFSDDFVNGLEPMRQSMLRAVAGLDAFFDKLRPDWVKQANKEAADAQDAYFKRVQEGAKESARELARFKQAAELSASGKTEGKHAPAPASAAAAPASHTSEWEAKLAEEKLAFQERMNLEGSFAQYSKQEEKKFWKDKLSLTEQGSADNLSVRRKLAELGLAIGQEGYQHELALLQAKDAAFKTDMVAKITLLTQEAALVKQRYGSESKEFEEAQKKITEARHQAAEQARAIRDGAAQSERDDMLQKLTLEEQTMRTAAQLGTINQAQVLAQQEQFEQVRTQIAKSALEARLADLENPVLNPDRNPVEVAKVNAELQALERAHQQRLGQIRGEQAIESAKYQTQFFQSMQGNMQTSIQNVLTGTQTINAGFKNMFASMGQTLAQTAAQMAATWAMTQLKMRLSSKQTALAETNNNAVEAAGGAYKAVVGIPIIGPILAPAAAAVAYGGVMAFGASASAAGGYDIPGTINPIVQTHAREMILPAKHADVIRTLADQGPGAAAGGGDVHLHVNAVDAQSVARLFRDNGTALAQELKRQHRNFAI